MPSSPRFADLHAFVRHLEARGELLRITAEVDPKFEASEIAQRVIRQDGPALLFERVKGADFPLVMNLYGSDRRMELALGRHPQAIGQELIETFQRLNPPSLSKFWDARATLLRARFMKPRLVRSAPVQEIVEAPRLDRLPNLWSWPRDAGPFITFGPTLTHHPVSGARNFGLYRLQIFDNTFKLADVQQTQSGNPWRATGSLEFIPTEFSMIRAQYTHDRSDPGGRVNNEGILQFTFTIGAHPAHTF